MFEERSSWRVWARSISLACLLALPSCGGCEGGEEKATPDAEDPCKPPAVDATGPIRFHEAVRFIYANSACPRQTGVEESKLDPLRVSVVRGTVRDFEGNPLANARISFPGHPEFGESHTFGDGTYDFVTHGGGEIVVRFVAEGRLAAQRSVAVGRNQFSVLHDVVLLAESDKATSVQFGDQWQLASGETSPIDDSGPRTVHVLFPPKVQATVVRADGTSEPLSGGTFRVTEYTRGALGDEAMPGTLPATSAYTYASNFGFDETRDAKSVTFDTPVIVYLDNFLHMKVGAAVPAGVFSPDDNAWGGEESGSVVAIAPGGALDANGDGQADGDAELQALGVRPGELETAKAVLEGGRSYLRVPLKHFSPWDFNWGFGPPPGSNYPPGANDPNSENDPCTTEGGSYFECESQTLFESIPVVGTDYSLAYASDRVPGRKNASTFSIPITDETIPGPVKRAELEVLVLGKRITKTIPGPIAPHTIERFTWDGTDAYGRAWPGQTFAAVRIGFVYDGTYMDTESFAAWGASVGSGGAVTGDAMRREIVLWRTYDVRVGTWSALGQSFGGWSLSPHHSYDAATGTLFYGDGRKRSTDGMGAAVDVVAGLPGDGDDTSSGDGGPAIAARLAGPWSTAVAPDGTLYIAELDGYRIRRVDTNGTIRTIAGTGKDGFSGDGGPGTAAEIHAPRALAVRRDGAVCFTSFDTVRCVGQDGIIRTVAGGGDADVSAAGVPAREASLLWLVGLAFGPDGAMYFGALSHVYKLDPNGKIVRHVAGGGDDEGNDVPALRASLFEPLGIAVDKDGAVYVAGGQGHRVRRIDPSGVVSTVAGTGEKGSDGDGGSALTAKLNTPSALAVDGDGTLYIGDSSTVRRVRRGRISTFAGGGDQEKIAPGILARRLESLWITGLTIGPDEAVYGVDFLRRQLLRFRRPMPEASVRETVIAEQDGSELYVFDARGRHLRTLDPLTRAVRKTFAYDGAGRLAHVDDAHGNVTTVQRDERGLATAIVGPFGAKTSLEYLGASIAEGAALAAITDPLGRRDQFGYEPGLLLTKRTDPGGGVHAMQYDADGLLARDANAENASWSLSRESESPRRVRVTTGMNRSRLHEQASLVDEDERRTFTAEDGTKRAWTRKQDGTEETAWPDGTTTTARFDPDPRFGMEAPYVSRSVVALPSGLSRTIDTARSARFAPDGTLLGLDRKRTTSDGESTATFDAGARTWTHSTTGGRQLRSLLDVDGRLVRSEIPGIAPVDFVYDGRGRLAEVRQGERRVTYGYGAGGEVQSVHDALGPLVTFERDKAQRTTASIQPDGARTTFAYDALDGVIGLSPPGKSTHAMTYAKDGLELSYQAPGAPLLATGYDSDRAWTSLTHEDGSRTTLERDAAGRPATLRAGSGSVTTSYGANGHVARLTGPGASSLDFVYDGALLKSVAAAGAARGSITWTYDPLFRPAAEAISGRDAIEYGYDADGLLVSAGHVTMNRDAATGRITNRTSSGVTESFGYTPHGEIANQQSSSGSGTLLEIAYEYDLRGRLVGKTENGARWRYEYDLANRLSRVLKNDAQIDAFTFDANGNRTDHGATVDDQDRLTRRGDATYTYTARGERATKVTPAGTTTYGYDGRGDLVSVVLPGGTRIEYTVDALGRRITRSRNGAVTHRWLYRSQLQPAAEVDAQGNVLTQFIYARGRNVPDAMVRGNTTYAIVTDHLGSVRYVVDNADEVAQTADYDVWGRAVTASGAGFQPFGFAGGMFDPETGLVHLGAREYDPETGTWTRKDPSRFRGGWNLYGYCYEDPINYVDVTGKNPLIVAIVVIDVGEVVLVAAVVTAGATAAYLGINRLWDEAKKGRDREGDDTRGLTPDEIRERFEESKTVQEIKDMIKRAEKFRGQRNKQKRRGNGQTTPGGPPGGPCPDDAEDSSDEAAE